MKPTHTLSQTLAMVCRQSHINVRRVQWVEWMLLTLQRLSALWRKRCCCWPHCDEDTLSSSLSLVRYISTWQRGKQFTVDSRCPWLWNTFCHVREMKKRRSSLWTTLNHMNIVLFPLIAASVAGLFSTDTKFLAAQSLLYFYISDWSGWNWPRVSELWCTEA